LSIQGAVARPGFYAIPSDALLADAVMVADGTTPEADPRKLKIERGGKTILASDGVQKAIAERRTVNDIRLRDGDQLVVPRRTRAALEDNLSFMWIIVSLAGGVYGLSRAF
jgi:protein involved in polysaccharide export with SLBB domain